MTSLVELNRRVVQRSIEIVQGVTADRLGRATPCSAWTLDDLLGHMIAQHYGFADSAEGNLTDLSVWAVRPVGSDPAASYTAAAERVLTAFAAESVLERRFWLPEIRDGGPYPASMAIGFHLVDYVVHGWDVAVSAGADAGYAPDLIAAALSVAEQVPTGGTRLLPAAAFAPVLPVAASSPMHRMLQVLGRSPTRPDEA